MPKYSLMNEQYRVGAFEHEHTDIGDKYSAISVICVFSTTLFYLKQGLTFKQEVTAITMFVGSLDGDTVKRVLHGVSRLIGVRNILIGKSGQSG